MPVLYGPASHEFYDRDSELAVGPCHVTYRITAMADGRVRVCAVFGSLDRERPAARFRLNGLFRDLPDPEATSKPAQRG